MESVSESIRSIKDTHALNTPELISEEQNKYNSNSTPPSSISTTHDISRAKYHMKELETFAVRVEEAAARAFPNRGRSRYSEVLVVLIQWEESDLDAQPGVNALRSMFKICYGFTTDIWSIPTTNAHNKLMLKAVNFIEQHGTEDNLIIIYYGGHAIVNNSRQATWSCKQDIAYSSVRWSAIQSVFEESKSDVLFLLDCCSAASGAPSGGPGVIETIAASGFEACSSGPGRHSFTSALLHVLDDWITRPSFSAAMLHSEILSVLNHERPERAHCNDQNKVEAKKTPIYILASDNPKSMSIEISRRTTTANTWSSALSPPVSEAIDSYSPENLHELTPDGKLVVPHVLVSIALEENQLLDVEAWYQWIRQFPALAQYALVEGVFSSHSTIILLSLPVLIWDMLPENLGVSFVAFVESRNLLSQISTKIDSETPRPKYKSRKDSGTLHVPPPLPLIQQIEQALQQHKQQSLTDWEAHFKSEKERLEAIVQHVRDETQKKELAFMEERNAYRETMERDMKEVRKESRVIKEEAKRAWEELGRHENEERERTKLLRDGLPISIGGIQVIPMGETDDAIVKDDRGRGRDVVAWVGSVNAGLKAAPKVPQSRDASRAPVPPENPQLQTQQSDSTAVRIPEHSTVPHPASAVEHSSSLHHKSSGIEFNASPHLLPAFSKPRSNASHRRFKEEKSIASFKTIGSAGPSPPRSVMSEYREESDPDEYATGIDDTASATRFGPGDQSEVDYVDEFLHADDDAPWDLPRQTPAPRELAHMERSKSDGDKPARMEKVEPLDPDQITLEPKSYKSINKHEPMKSKEPEHASLLDWEKQGMQQKLGEHALPRPNPERALEPTSPEPTKLKDVDQLTLQALENGHTPHESGNVTPPPRKSAELAGRTDLGPLTQQALKTYEKLQEELDIHQATRRPERVPERVPEHIPNRLSHITEKDGDWEPRTPGKASVGGSPQQKRGEEKVRDKKALAAVEDAIKKLIIPEMEELKKEATHTKKNPDGSTTKIPWDSDEKSIKSGKSVTRSDSVKHGKGKGSTKKAFEAVEDAIKKEAEALKKKEEEEEEVEALKKLRKEQKERKRKEEEEKDKGKREADDKDFTKAPSAHHDDSKLQAHKNQHRDGKEIVGERALVAVDEAIKKLARPELEALKREDSLKRNKHDKQNLGKVASQQSLAKRDESPITEKLSRQNSVSRRDESPAKLPKATVSKLQNEATIEHKDQGKPTSPLSKQKSERGLWWMERKPPTQQKDDISQEQLPSTSYSRQEKGKVQQRTASNPPPSTEPRSPRLDNDFLPQTDAHHWDEFRFRGRDVTPSLSSIPTAIPRSSNNTSTLGSNFNNPWFNRTEESFTPMRPVSDQAEDSHPFSPTALYAQFAQSELALSRERPLSTPTMSSHLALDPTPRPHPVHAHTISANPNNPYSHFAEFEQSLSTPTLQRIDTGSSSHSAAQSMHTTHTTQPIHSPHIQTHQIHSHSSQIFQTHLNPHQQPSYYSRPHAQHAPISAIDQNPKHSFTFTSGSGSGSGPIQGQEQGASPPPPYGDPHPHMHVSHPHRSNSQHNHAHHLNTHLSPHHHSHQHQHPHQHHAEGTISPSNLHHYASQPLPSPSSSETENLLKNLILPELEALAKGDEARKAEEERSRLEWEREFGVGIL